LVFYQLYILLFVCLVCTSRLHVGGGRGVTKNTEILRRHEAHGRFSLLRKNNTDEARTPKQPTASTSGGHCHTEVFNN